MNEKSIIFLACFFLACIALFTSNEYFTGHSTSKPDEQMASNSSDESSMDSDEESVDESQGSDSASVESSDDDSDAESEDNSNESVDSNNSELLRNNNNVVQGVRANTRQEETVSPDLLKEINSNAQKKIQGNNLEPVKQKGHTASSNNSGTWTQNLDETWKKTSDPNSATPSPKGPTGMIDNDFASVAPYNGSGKADTSVQELYNSNNYLPDGNNKWADMPVKVNQKDLIGSTIRHVGVNTIGQSLRNANLQLREEPPNPQDNVSPWLNTTIDRDLLRKPLC
jgi:hypothetical protein